MKPIDVEFVLINFVSGEKKPKFKVGDHVTILRYKNIFAKGYAPNWPKEVFVISKIKNTVLWTYVINYLNVERIIRNFLWKRIVEN